MRRNTLFSTSAVLVRRGEPIGKDRYGRPIYGDSPLRTPTVAWFEPSSASEDSTVREQFTRAYTLYVPLDVEVSGVDVVELAGLPGEYQIVGEPLMQPSGFVVDGYWRMVVERVTG